MRTKAVFLDALGTLVELEPPWTRLACAIGGGGDADRMAWRREMAYYRDHAHEATDPESLRDLRRRCAELLGRELGREVDVETMMAAIRFHPATDARPTLARLRERGLTLVCVSNWDYALPEVLDAAGLGDLLDGVVTSAAAGARKPDPAIFRVALEIAGCEPDEALHVGDTPEEDLAGAGAAGIPALLIDRAGAGEARRLKSGAPPLRPSGSTIGGRIASLAEIEDHLRP